MTRPHRQAASCRSPLAVGLAVLLVVGWMVGGRPSENRPPCAGDCVAVDEADVRAAERRFEQMREALAREVEGVPKRVLAGGDTCGMRRPGLYRRVDDRLDRRFTLAVVVQDPDARLRLLDAVLSDSGQLPVAVRLRVDLERVRTLLRAGRLAEAGQVLADMPSEPSEELPPPCVSDVNFYRGLVAMSEGRTDEALSALGRAVAQDPFSFQARVAHLEALYLRQLRGFRSNAECADTAAAFVEGLHQLVPQLEDPRQLLDFADALARAGSPRTKPARLAIAYAYLAGGHGALAEAHARAGLRLHSALPRTCSRLLDEEFERMIARIADEESEGKGSRR